MIGLRHCRICARRLSLVQTAGNTFEFSTAGLGYIRSYSREFSEEQRNLPQQTDLLDRYRGLVALGRLQYDEEQVRVVMKLRRLQKALENYAPPAIQSHLLALHASSRTSPQSRGQPWWTVTDSHDKLQAPPDMKALMRVKSHAEELAALDTPKGLFLKGHPGSGKSFLIDSWFSSLPTPYKARKHYNQLVLEVYRAVWVETQRRMASVRASDAPPSSEPRAPWNTKIRDRWRELLRTNSMPTFWTRSSLSHLRPTDPSIAFVVAKRLVLHHWLLVFDEIQLLDVSSATLLADVLTWFWIMGGVVVGTSNKIPDDLYKNGVQRARLEPFVEALKARCPVVSIQSEVDWRHVKGSRSTERTWVSWGQESEFEDKLKNSCIGDTEPRSEQLRVFGRILHVPWSSGGVCKFTFGQLCEKSLGPADYLTLASNYHTIAITSLPTLKLSAKNQARRFISLIDALYESRCRLICLAESNLEDLFFPDARVKPAEAVEAPLDTMMAESVAETQDVYRPNVSSYSSPKMAEAPVGPATALPLDTLSIFSGKDEQFAYKRALSRLKEMTSSTYEREELWAPLPMHSRKWEEPPAAEESQVSRVNTPKRNGDSQAVVDDFADETSGSIGPGPMTDRPIAPRISHAHMWGVREDWGGR